MKKLFAIFMIAMMLMCFMPSAAFAYDAGMTPGQICAEKTVTGPNQNGNYEIKLSVVGKNVTESTGSNADVVLVVDNSGSMREGTTGSDCDTPKEDFGIVRQKTRRNKIYTTFVCPKCEKEYSTVVDVRDGDVTKDLPDICDGKIDGERRISVAKVVAKEFAAGILKDNRGNLLAIIGFSHGQNDGGSNDSGAIKISHGLTDSLSDINSSIDSMQADGGTNYSAALNKAYGYLNARTDKTRPGYVIFISDGAPGYSGESLDDEDWNGSKEIAKLKEAGITVFTVGIDLDTEPANYLKNMASDANHFINVTGDNYAKQLSNILKLWAKQINSKPAGTEAVMEDIVDTEKFEVVGFSSGIKQDSDGRYLWEIGDITEEAQTQTIEIKPLVSGTDINTNTDVNLTYKDPNGETQIMPKEEIGDPTVDVAKVTFNVENGKWADESTNSKTVLVPLSVIGSKGTLKSNDVPTGMKANTGYEGGAWDVTPDTSTDGITGDVTYTYAFTKRVPVITDTTVTFKVVNGTWSDGTTDAKTVTVKLTDGKGTLDDKYVPTGMKANTGYEGGAWDVTPDTSTDGITGDVTYTYAFTKRVPVITDTTVTFKVVNGTWSDGTTDAKTVTVKLTDGKGTLGADDVPTGMKANAGYEGGAWDVTPDTSTDGITGAVTYTYIFTKKVPVETDTVVTFKVINGTWSDGTTDAKTVTVKLTDGKGTLNINDVPTGMKAKAGYEGGAWDVTPDTSTNGITGAVTYTFCFSKKDTPNPPIITVYYTIKWNNYDDTNLETDRFCYYGQMPSYDGLTPVKPADEKYTYEFIGWDKEVVKVTKDETYTAQFKAIEKEDPTDPTEPEKPTKPEKPDKPDKPTNPCKPDTEVPKTGDTAADNMLLSLFMLTLSAFGGMVLWFRRADRR